MSLYIVATPIGNLEDITLRALRILREADIILCEDTRVTRKLLAHYGIRKPLLAYHQHSGTAREDEIRRLLAEGKNLALVSDAGTPGINDPGNQLIAHLLAHPFLSHKNSDRVNITTNMLEGSWQRQHPQWEEKLKIIPIPGPNAAVAALSASGFPTDQFLFLGFPPLKKRRRLFFAEIAAMPYTVVFYESSHRILKTLGELGTAIGDRPVVVARELTKMFETIYRGTANNIYIQLNDEKAARGEFVIVVGQRRKEERAS